MENSETDTLPIWFNRIRQRLSIVRAILVSGLLGGNLATLSLIASPLKAWYNLQNDLFYWRMISGKGLPMRQLHDLIAVPDQVSLEVLPKIDYLTWWDSNYTKDIFYLTLLARVLSPKAIFEIGTLQGYTSLLFSLNTPPRTNVYTLDLPLDKPVKPMLATTYVDNAHIAISAQAIPYLYLSHLNGSKVKQLYGDSAQFDFSPYESAIDLFFIDGAHSYEYVRSDTLNALKCMRAGGMVVWHDYGRWGVNGVSRWLHEFANSGRTICRLPGSSLAVLKV